MHTQTFFSLETYKQLVANANHDPRSIARKSKREKIEFLAYLQKNDPSCIISLDECKENAKIVLVEFPENMLYAEISLFEGYEDETILPPLAPIEKAVTKNEAIAILLAVKAAAEKSLDERDFFNRHYLSNTELLPEAAELSEEAYWDKLQKDVDLCEDLAKTLPSISGKGKCEFIGVEEDDPSNVKFFKARVGNAYAYSNCNRRLCERATGHFFPLCICFDRSELKKSITVKQADNGENVFAQKHFERLETIEAATKFLATYAKIAGVPDNELSDFMLLLELASIIPSEENKHKVKKYPF